MVQGSLLFSPPGTTTSIITHIKDWITADYILSIFCPSLRDRVYLTEKR